MEKGKGAEAPKLVELEIIKAEAVVFIALKNDWTDEKSTILKARTQDTATIVDEVVPVVLSGQHIGRTIAVDISGDRSHDDTITVVVNIAGGIRHVDVGTTNPKCCCVLR